MIAPKNSSNKTYADSFGVIYSMGEFDTHFYMRLNSRETGRLECSYFGGTVYWTGHQLLHQITCSRLIILAGGFFPLPVPLASESKSQFGTLCTRSPLRGLLNRRMSYGRHFTRNFGDA